FNRPEALRLVLLALTHQTQLPSEVIVADDGSTFATRLLINQLKNHVNYPLKQIWQKDEGFQAAKIRNKASFYTNADYLIFLDGDCIPFPDFIEKHRLLAEPQWFVSGHRLLLEKKGTETILKTSYPVYKDSAQQWILRYFHRQSNRLFPLLRVPFNKLRKLHAKRWQGAKSCNLGLWKKDFLTVNGFDERFVGWGYEDSDLVIRLIRAGVYRKSGKFAIPVIHLWHPLNGRAQQGENLSLLKQITQNKQIRAKVGFDRFI
ncbi:glycosyl transferase family 2, partial [Rickettsiella grylli]|uniref:glycosyltransferase family 2 protein n=1 Tax=Rickettsiella grylli TaxID=59196 RepID=UPI0008FD6639